MPRHNCIPASYIVVQNGTKILLSRRLNTGYMDGLYQLPSGHVEAGEMPGSAAIREAREEVGIVIAPEDLRFLHVLYRKKQDDTGDRVDFFFVATRWTGEIANPEPQKCGGWEWWDLNRLPEETIPYLRAVLQTVSAGRAYSDMPK